MPIEYNRPGYREDFSSSGTFQGKCHCFVTACDSYQDIRVAGIHSGMHFEAVTPRWAHSWPIRSKQMQVGVQDVTIGCLHALCEFLCVCIWLDACKRGYARGKGMAFPNVSPDVLSIPFEPNVVVLQKVVLGGCRSIGFKMRSSRTVRIQGQAEAEAYKTEKEQSAIPKLSTKDYSIRRFVATPNTEHTAVTK